MIENLRQWIEVCETAGAFIPEQIHQFDAYARLLEAEILSLRGQHAKDFNRGYDKAESQFKPPLVEAMAEVARLKAELEYLPRMTKDRDQWRNAAQKELDRANELARQILELRGANP